MEKQASYIYLEYYPEFEDFEHNLCHELVHIFRGVIKQDKYKQVQMVDSLFEEALCGVIATKATKLREQELRTRGLYKNLIDVCALEQIIYALEDNEIRRLSFMPKTEKELKELTFLVLDWISSEQYRKNIRKIWRFKIKETVYY